MKNFALSFILISVSLFGGCNISPKYQVINLESSFSLGMKQHNRIGIMKFDIWTTNEFLVAVGLTSGLAGTIISSGAEAQASAAIGIASGIVGILIADAVTEDEVESFGINFQNATIKILSEEMTKKYPNYKLLDLMDGTTIEEVSKRFKFNRLWGMQSAKPEEISAFFIENPDVEYAIHIKSQAGEMTGAEITTLYVDTDWIIYHSSAKSVGKIRTQSVEKGPKEKLLEDIDLKKVITLQHKNVLEFIRLLLESKN